MLSLNHQINHFIDLSRSEIFHTGNPGVRFLEASGYHNSYLRFSKAAVPLGASRGNNIPGGTEFLELPDEF